MKKDINKKFNIFFIFSFNYLDFSSKYFKYNLPLDTIEALAWGSNLDWGFNKHPPVSALAVERIFYKIFGNQDWAYYFFSQLFVIIATFLLFLNFLKIFLKIKYLSLISIFLLEEFISIILLHQNLMCNVCQLPFWALSVFILLERFKR